MNKEAVAAQMTPYQVDIAAGEIYCWCADGRSKNEPYCNNSHKGTGFEPVAFAAEKTETVYLRGCKRTSNRPFCDDTHDLLG